MNFQLAASPIMQAIIDFHHDIQFFLILIIISVVWILFRSVSIFRETNPTQARSQYNHDINLELIWTIVPTLILVAVAVPSFSLLYGIEELHSSEFTLKVFGNQWYWSYEYSDYVNKQGNQSINLDSYMIFEDDLIDGHYRLLEVDQRIKVPERTQLRILTTTLDVIHSWAVPALGVKIDACPGRLNQVGVFIERGGFYFGQCSELCGINHGFMPVCIETRSKNTYSTLFENIT